MIDLIQQLVTNWFWIWTSGGTNIAENFFAYATGTVMLCMPGYLVSIGPKVFGFKAKIFDRILRWTLIVNAVLALAPLAIPVLAVYYGGGGGLYLIRQRRRRLRQHHQRQIAQQNQQGNLP